MSRRIALPGADELFRSTGDGRAAEVEPMGAGASSSGTGGSARISTAVDEASRPDPSGLDSVTAAVQALEADDLEFASQSVRSAPRRRARAVADRRPSGREHHNEKITVYVSADELLDLEHARLALRGDHGLPVDRGRVVREALAVVLADFEAKGEASILVRRLRGR